MKGNYGSDFCYLFAISNNSKKLLYDLHTVQFGYMISTSYPYLHLATKPEDL